MKKVAIIGGGASGMMTAAGLTENGFIGEIHIFEKNEKLGTKVLLTGGGRCNITANNYDKKAFLSKFPRGGEFIKKVYGQFSPKKLYQRFENRGVPLKTEEDNRTFPESEDPQDILNVFYQIFQKNGIKIHYKTKVEDISKNNGNFTLKTSDGTYSFDAIVISTGGKTYPQTGSTGQGYGFAEKLGHTVTELRPSLHGFKTSLSVSGIAGISFPDGIISCDEEKLYGPLLFTHQGISGPVVFSLSSVKAFREINPDKPLKIQFIPEKDRTYNRLEEYIKSAISDSPHKTIKNLLSLIYPKRFSEFVLAKKEINADTKLGSLTRKQRQTVSKVFGEGLELDLIQKKTAEGMVTAGGVDLTEIHRNSMESALVENLYCTGEVVNVDGFTGGFNLRWCMASGYIAGKSISEKQKINQ